MGEIMWRGIMRQFLDHPSHMTKNGMFRKQFERALADEIPEAHYLKGLRLACREKDLALAKKHMFKPVNRVPEAVFVMAMLAACGGETDVGEVFTDQLMGMSWPTVLGMGDTVFGTLERMQVTRGTAYTRTWNCAVSEFHNIYDRCEECYIFWCTKEFCRRC